MKSVEFTSRLQHGQITVPSQFALRDGQMVQVRLSIPDSGLETAASEMLKRTAGAWEGDLVLEPQGD